MCKGSQKIDNSIVILEDGQRKKDKIKLRNQKGKLASLLTQTSNKNAEDAMLHVLNGDPLPPPKTNAIWQNLPSP